MTNHWPWQLTSCLGYDDTRDCQEKRPISGWPSNNRGKIEVLHPLTGNIDIYIILIFKSHFFWTAMVHSRITFMVKKKKSLFIVWGSLVPHVTSGISLISQHSVQFHLNTGAGAAHMRHQQGTFAGWWRPCVCSCRWFATHTKLSRRALKCNDIGLRPLGCRSWTSMWARQTPSSSVSPVCCTVAWWSASILQASQSFNKKREGQDGECLHHRAVMEKFSLLAHVLLWTSCRLQPCQQTIYDSPRPSSSAITADSTTHLL